MVPLLLGRASKGLKEWALHGRGALKGRSGRKGVAGGGVSVECVGLLERPGAHGSSGSVTSTVAGAVSLCCLVVTKVSSI